jgi:hypothetical protein
MVPGRREGQVYIPEAQDGEEFEDYETWQKNRDIPANEKSHHIARQWSEVLLQLHIVNLLVHMPS